jgi:hypothetical protein
MAINNTLIFIPNAEPEFPHADCECCGNEWPIDLLKSISNPDDAERIMGILEFNPYGDYCPECRDALVKEARETCCPYCRRWSCPGPIDQTDADRWDCPRR